MELGAEWDLEFWRRVLKLNGLSTGLSTGPSDYMYCNDDIDDSDFDDSDFDDIDDSDFDDSDFDDSDDSDFDDSDFDNSSWNSDYMYCNDDFDVSDFVRKSDHM